MGSPCSHSRNDCLHVADCIPGFNDPDSGTYMAADWTGDLFHLQQKEQCPAQSIKSVNYFVRDFQDSSSEFHPVLNECPLRGAAGRLTIRKTEARIAAALDHEQA